MFIGQGHSKGNRGRQPSGNKETYQGWLLWRKISSQVIFVWVWGLCVSSMQHRFLVLQDQKGGRQNPNVMASNTPLIIARYKKFKEKVFYIFVISEIDYWFWFTRNVVAATPNFFLGEKFIELDQPQIRPRFYVKILTPCFLWSSNADNIY